jgi:CheY-like chemotaxis protein
MAELVLVVEDEAHVRELVSYTLQGAGYRVVAVDDGESALREIGLAMPNLIVLDVRLPGRRLGLLLERETLIHEAAAIDALRAVDRAKSDFIAKYVRVRCSGRAAARLRRLDSGRARLT